MFIKRRSIPGLAINSYVIGDETTKKAAVIDPVRDVSAYLNLTDGFEITDIIETHVHADFVSGALELKHALKGAPVIHCSGMGGEKWTPSYADHVVKDGDSIQLGSEVRLEAMHTPGHTPEHMSWKLYDLKKSSTTPALLFSGDFLFVGDVGRPDLLGEESRKALAKELYASVFNRMQQYSDSLEILPSHGAGSLCGKALGSAPTTTLGHERQFNPSFKKIDETTWIDQLMEAMPKAPPYFSHMKQINVRGPKILGEQLPGQNALSAMTVYQMQEKGVQVLDVRSNEAFAAAHIPGAIHIPFSPQLPTYAGWVLNHDQHFVLVCENKNQVQEAITALIRVGFDNIEGHLEDGILSWKHQGLPLEHLESISTEELAKRLESQKTPVVLDVRSDGEWASGHINHALHYQLGPIRDDLLEDLNKDEPICVICGGGTRSSIMASCLQRAGYKHVSNVLGGMGSWKSKSFPTL